VVLAVTLTGWIVIGIVAGLALWILGRIAWMIRTNEELEAGGSDGLQLTSGIGPLRKLIRRLRGR
jgi:hypothetical protein